MIQTIKDIYNRYKLGEDFSSLTENQLVFAQLFNIFVIGVFAIIFMLYTNIYIAILSSLMIAHYIYRMYLLKQYYKTIK